MACIHRIVNRIVSSGGEAHFLLPEGARGMAWVSQLDAECVHFPDFTYVSFARAMLSLVQVSRLKQGGESTWA